MRLEEKNRISTQFITSAVSLPFLLCVPASTFVSKSFWWSLPWTLFSSFSLLQSLAGDTFWYQLEIKKLVKVITSFSLYILLLTHVITFVCSTRLQGLATAELHFLTLGDNKSGQKCTQKPTHTYDPKLAKSWLARACLLCLGGDWKNTFFTHLH